MAMHRDRLALADHTSAPSIDEHSILVSITHFPTVCSDVRMFKRLDRGELAVIVYSIAHEHISLM